MPMQQWMQHPIFLSRATDGIRTRLGIAPNHVSFRAGVFRTHLLTALFAHAAARQLSTTASVFIRLDDTDRARTGFVETSGLVKEITDVGDIPIASIPGSIPSRDGALRQSERSDRYRKAIAQLDADGLTLSREGAIYLSLSKIDHLLAKHGINPSSLVQDSLINISAVPVEHGEEQVPLTRADGSALWHLASVTDDIDLKISLIVRGTDKINSVAVQERLRWILTRGEQSVGYMFVPRLMELDRALSRISHLLAEGVRPSTLRWFLAESFIDLLGHRPPESFAELVPVMRQRLPALRDSTFDHARLISMDRKLSATLSPTTAAIELGRVVGQDSPSALAFVANEFRRPLLEQRRLYSGLTEREITFDQAPSDMSSGLTWLEAYLANSMTTPPPPVVRWILTGRSIGPGVDAILGQMSYELINRRLEAVKEILR